MKPRRAWWAGVVLGLAANAVAATPPPVVPTTGCVAGTDFERQGYTVRTARARSPFVFLPWIRASVDAADRMLVELEGRPYRRTQIDLKSAEIERFDFAAIDVEQRVSLRLTVISVSRCADRQLDLEFFVVAPHVAPVLGGTIESRRTEAAAPERQAGADAMPGRLRIAPRLGYDAAARASAGLRAEYRPAEAGKRETFWDAVLLDAYRAGKAREVCLALAGSKDMVKGVLAHAEWRLDYASSSQPAQSDQIGHDRFSAAASAITRPLGTLELPLRLGALLESGRYDSNRPGGAVAPDATLGASYTSLKLYVGTTTRLEHQALAASFAVELGSTQGGPRVDWVKTIVDAAHERSVRVADHRRLSIESRLTAGALRLPGTAPLGVRFFGGGLEQQFIPGDAWQIRANPVIRSFGTNALGSSAGGIGGTHFVALNLTAALPIRHHPLVPSELSADKEFRELLDSQFDTATSLVQNEYEAKDPHFKTILGRLGELQATLAALQVAVDAAQAARPNEPAESFKPCSRAIAGANRRLKEAQQAKDESAQIGGVGVLLPGDADNPLSKIQEQCAEGLNARLADAGIASKVAALNALQADMQREFAAIDRPAAQRSAQNEMRYVRRVVSTLIDDVNLVAISPLFMLDAVRLGPSGPGAGTRVGIGGGVRVTLVDSIDLSAGYMANLNRGPQEPRGAFFLTMQFKDLF